MTIGKRARPGSTFPARTQSGTDLQAPVRASIEEVAADVAANLATFNDHSARHENGGADEISIAGLSGVAADPQNPAAHKASHENGGGDEISVAGLSGVLADPQTPAAHASDHENGGGDEIDVTGLSGLLADPQTPAAHTHGSGDLTGGASGTFTTADAKTVTVVNGLITAIV